MLELLGTGGMGDVYRAHDRELDELVALKVIHADLAADPILIARFRHEVKLARRVTHTNVARTFELGSANGIMFCTMELIEGESLTRRLAGHRKLSVAEATAIAAAVCEGLGAAHAADVIHRDIKPDNILLAADGRVIVADFGVASVRVRGDGELSGTPAYMAPEQALGQAPTPAADVYAVGVVLYEMLSGRRAFTGSDVTTILSAKQTTQRLTMPPGDASPELAEVIARATERDLAARLPTAAALLHALSPWARPRRATSASPIKPTVASGLHHLIIVAPRDGVDESRTHLVDAIYDELLTRLARRPRVKVQPRVEAPLEPGATVITMVADTHLELTMSRDGTKILTTRLPIAVEQIGMAAEAATNAIAAALSLDDERVPDPNAAAFDLLLRARHIVARDLARTGEAIELLSQASALAPHDPRIAAADAISQVRRAFFVASAQPNVLMHAAELARAAVAAAPESVDSHLAMGHVELHIGECHTAAAHFRRAISCAPLNAEAHEQLGRLLLEAGFLEPALARLDDAIAIAPQRWTARWEIARAYALDARWDDHDHLLQEIGHTSRERVFARARFMWWRGRFEESRPLLQSILDTAAFDPVLIKQLFAVFCDGAWESHREAVLSVGRETSSRDLRRRAFAAQLAAEGAGHAGDVAACNQLITNAVDAGLFDLHWLDRCPLLASARPTPQFQALRAVVKKRADAILDALYGDHEVVGHVETELAPSALVSQLRSR
ncbi:MAG: protein kinase [Myxococcales bacterium]|nr:protein kinase [Myxococcales bacterium]